MSISMPGNTIHSCCSPWPESSAAVVNGSHSAPAVSENGQAISQPNSETEQYDPCLPYQERRKSANHFMGPGYCSFTEKTEGLSDTLKATLLTALRELESTHKSKIQLTNGTPLVNIIYLLIAGCSCDNQEIVNRLIKNMNDYDQHTINQEIRKQRPYGGDTLLNAACYYGRLEMVQWLILEVHVDPDIINDDGETPLITACLSLQRPIFKFLLSLEPDPKPESKNTIPVININAQETVYGNTPLHLVIQQSPNGGRTHFHKTCLDDDVSKVRSAIFASDRNALNITDNDGWTPLHLICLARHGESGKCIVTILMWAGINVDETDNDGRSALDLARLAKNEFAIGQLTENLKIADIFSLTDFPCFLGHHDPSLIIDLA